MIQKFEWASPQPNQILQLEQSVVDSAVDGDPHFMIELPEQEDALCFNIDDRPGTIFNLVRDQLAGKY